MYLHAKKFGTIYYLATHDGGIHFGPVTCL